MNRSYKSSVSSKYYFMKYCVIGIVTKQLIVVGLKFQSFISIRKIYMQRSNRCFMSETPKWWKGLPNLDLDIEVQ